MNEFEERLLALLETAEQQAHINTEQSSENEKLLETIRELVAHVAQTKPVLDDAVKLGSVIFSDAYVEKHQRIVANAVYQATSRNIDEAIIGSIEKQVTSKFDGVTSEFDGIADAANAKIDGQTNHLISTINQATVTIAEGSQSLIDLIKNKALWIGSIAVVVTSICLLMLLIVGWLVKPDPEKAGELKAEIQELNEIKARKSVELEAQKRRYDMALTHSNTQYINNELYIQVDRSNCSKDKGDVKYCRLVGAMPRPQALYGNMPAPQF